MKSTIHSRESRRMRSMILDVIWKINGGEGYGRPRA